MALHNRPQSWKSEGAPQAPSLDKLSGQSDRALAALRPVKTAQLWRFQSSTLEFPENLVGAEGFEPPTLSV